MNQEIIEKVVTTGVKNLKVYGYELVNEENIFTDMIYSAFFKKMLEQNLGLGYDEEIQFLINKTASSN